MGITEATFWCGSGETRVEVASDVPVRGGWFVRAEEGGAFERVRLEAAPGGAAARVPGPDAESGLFCPRDPAESWLFAVTGPFGRVRDCVAEGADPAALLTSSWEGPRPRWTDRCRLAPTPAPAALPTPARPPLPPRAPPGRLDDWGAECRGDIGALWATFAPGAPPASQSGLVFGQLTGADIQRQVSEVSWAGRGERGRLEVSATLRCEQVLDAEHATWVFAVTDGDRVVDCLAVGHDPVGLLAGAYEDRRDGPPPPVALRAAFEGCRVRWGQPAAGLPIPRRPRPDPEPTLQVAPGCPLPVPPAFSDPAVAVLAEPGRLAFLTASGGVRRSEAPEVVLGGGLARAVDTALDGGVAWRLDRENLVRIGADGVAWPIPLPLGPGDRAYDEVLVLRDGRVAVWGARNQVVCATNNRFDLAIFDGAWRVERDVIGEESIDALFELPDGTLVGAGSVLTPWVDHAFGEVWWDGGDEGWLEAAEVLPDGTIHASGSRVLVDGRPGAFVTQTRPDTELAEPGSVTVEHEGHRWSVERGAVLRDGRPWWSPAPSSGALVWRDLDGGTWHETPGGWLRRGPDDATLRVPGRSHQASRFGVWGWGPEDSVGGAEGLLFAGPPGPIDGGLVGPGGRAMALTETGTWLREGGSWTFDPRPPPPHHWLASWSEDGPLLVNDTGVWRWSDGWVRFVDAFHPTVGGPRSDQLVVVPSEPDEDPQEPPFLWDGAKRTPIELPTRARYGAGGGPGSWWVATEDGGWRFTEDGWRRWWSLDGGYATELPDGDLVLRSSEGSWVLPACGPTAPR
jgi:hypothetical protein